MFPTEKLEFEDFYLLEAFQIAYLPGWISEREFAVVLWANPSIENFLKRKCPSISNFINKIKKENGPAKDDKDLTICIKKVIETCSDILIYNKCPQVYDNLEFHNWDFKEVTSVASLDDKIILDGGSGTGRVALEVAKYARYVFAMEPVTRLRQFIKDKAKKAKINNVYVIDGFLHSIPLPDNFIDVLITSHALGWRLRDELQEFERVVKNQGYIIHCPGTADNPSEEETHNELLKNSYSFGKYKETDGWKRKYWKKVTK
ncbi:MAG: methyltransferase domain-containing protein [Atribacterota bacterium]